MSEFGDDLDEEGNAGGAYPADWRPSPEVFAKMSSKEKRQLRNKISARNFRVRRKEYISTLEGDIAERDRLLEAIRNELGSSRNENLALRREVENLKRVLIDGRGVDASADGSLDHLPPPAPLPEKSAAEVLAAQAAAASSNNALFKPNTQKDLPTSPRNGANSFWGGNAGGMNGMFGSNGVTAVHTTFVPAPVVVGLGGANMGGLSPNMGVYGAAWNQPSPFAPALQENISSPFAPALQENMNPLMRASGENQRRERETMKKGSPAGEQKENSFEGFADSNMFTMKNMDAYRMHLWGKMAAQYHAHHHQQQQQPRAIAPSSPPQLPQQQTQEATTNVYHPNLLQLQQLAHQQQQLVQQQALYQQQLQYQQQQGLAAKMGVGRTWFLTPSSASTPGSTPSDTRLPLGSTTNVPLGTTNNLVALLSGKGSVLGSGGYTGASFKRHPPKSVGGDKENGEQQKNQLELAKKQQEQAQAAMLAVVASQTILRKLGQAFWDAFSGSTSASASSQGGLAKRFEAPRSTSGPGQQYQTSSNQARPDWDADKVRKVLDGTAVLRIVDVDQLHKLEGPSARPVVNRSATTIPASSTLSRTAPSSTPSSTIMSKVPSIKEEPSSSSLANCPWTQCSREWCSTDTLRNVSKGGSVSVPGSPVVRAVGPATAMGVSTSCGSSTLVGGLSGKTDAAKEEQNRKMASLLEEGMKGLRL
ncbi:hypothetical protein BKA70DRAFT_1332500 [Coprinopsis sp. MPI-PUGE-AT-0042]|nr:hypothetical protein BKA70DRAFT_1332500 [Coprinopsis sp. MPI-PUGE-AT-0042]